MHAKLPSSLWGHAVLHAAALLKIRPSLLNVQTSHELLTGTPPNVNHFRTFGCQVWVPVTEPRKMIIGHHRQEGIYVGFDSPSIIRYIDPATGNLFKARFANCKFIEYIFPKVRQPNPNSPLNFVAPETFTMNHDPPTSLREIETLKLLKIKAMAENTPDEFSTKDRIIRKAVPGTGAMLPTKRLNSKPTPRGQSKRPRADFTIETHPEPINELNMDFSPDSDPSPESDLDSDLNGTYSLDQQGHHDIRPINSDPESYGPKAKDLQGHYEIRPSDLDPGLSGPKAGSLQVQCMNTQSDLDPGSPSPLHGRKFGFGPWIPRGS